MKKNKMNPSMADEEQAYNEGLKQGIRLIGAVVDRKDQAETLIRTAFAARKEANAPVADIPDNQRVRVYMANPDLNTYGSGKYTGLMMKHAGALNVAAATVKGARQVSLEQVLQWNPQVIFVQDRYPQVVKQIESDPQWQGIDAVKKSPRLADARVCQSLGLPDAGSAGPRRAVDGQKALSFPL